MMERIAVLGSTGSIGVNTLAVISSQLLKNRFRITALSADSNVRLLAAQAAAFRPKVVCVRDADLARDIKNIISHRIKIAFGIEGLKEIVSRPDVDKVVFAISGSACLIPLIAAIENKKQIALANKESLVSAGSFIMALARKNGVKIVPIDSEHSAIFQCVEGREKFLSKIYLTGSGGPLLNVPAREFDRMSMKFILNHPRWRMGKKVSVDSATMMNKGLEVIEAKHLFGVDEAAIEVLIHPEAIIHSMVELVDRTIFAQLGVPDMRMPIQYALTYPSRFKALAERLDLAKISNLSFRKPDLNKFPCLKLAIASLKRGGTHPAVLNAADEEAVKNYLDGEMRFSEIPAVIEKVLERHNDNSPSAPAIGDVLEAEQWAKEEVNRICCH